MLKAHTEIGIGNATFINTELEYPDGSETRQPGFIKFDKFHSVYIRIWIRKTAVSVDTRLHVMVKHKPRKAFKLLLGLSGYINS